MEIMLGLAAAVILFLLLYKIIRPPVNKQDKVKHYVCDVCKGNICECRSTDPDQE